MKQIDENRCHGRNLNWVPPQHKLRLEWIRSWPGFYIITRRCPNQVETRSNFIKKKVIVFIIQLYYLLFREFIKCRGMSSIKSEKYICSLTHTRKNLCHYKHGKGSECLDYATKLQWISGGQPGMRHSVALLLTPAVSTDVALQTESPRRHVFAFKTSTCNYQAPDGKHVTSL